MKILYFDEKKYACNKIIHSDSIIELDNFVDLTTVGNDLVSKKNIKIQDINELSKIIKSVNPDCVITYNSGEKNAEKFKHVEEFLANIKCAKIHISTDYCRDGFNENQANWFSELGYSAALFRHKVSLDYECSVDKHFLPFSVNSKNFEKNESRTKTPFVGFIGAYADNDKYIELYKPRNEAIKYFESKGIMNNLSSPSFKRITGSRYYRALSSNGFGLCCGAICNFLVAKHFEIPAAGSILVCDGNAVGIDLLPEWGYIKYGTEDSSLEEAYNKILYLNRNAKEKRKITTGMKNFVRKEHSHKKRAAQLIEIIKRYI